METFRTKMVYKLSEFSLTPTELGFSLRKISKNNSWVLTCAEMCRRMNSDQPEENTNSSDLGVKVYVSSVSKIRRNGRDRN